MPPAIIGGAIAAGGAVAASKISSNGAKSAADASTAASNQAAQLQSQQYQQNAATLAPYVGTGNAAMGQINALLGLGGTAGTAGTPGQADYAGYVNANPDLLTDWQRFHGNMSADEYGRYHYSTYGQGEGRNLPMTGGTQGMPGVSAADAQAAAEQGFANFRNSTGYDFRVKQGMNALNSGYAGAGTIKSGAAIKGAVDYGQGMASQEFWNYLGALGTQQGLGLKAASAQAGVGGDYANNLGAIYMQNGENQANNALLRSANAGQLAKSLANIGGSVLSQGGFGGGGLNMSALNAATASYNPVINNLYSGQTGDWRTW
jgi:hypothetical protein